MAILQEITVPLLAVNDTSLTVVDIAFGQGAYVKKGEVVLVLETSKTTYDVLAESDGFINYFCQRGDDYEVNYTIAKIFSEKDEIVETVNVINQEPAALNGSGVTKEIWEGETMFSAGAIKLIESSGIARTVFTGLDFVSREDVELVLGTAKKTPGKRDEVAAYQPPAFQQVDANKVIVEKLSSYKKKEIEYLSSVQSGGITSTVNIFVETAGIFAHINQALQSLKNSLLPVIIYETARLLEKFTPLNAYFNGDSIAFYRQVDIGFAIDIDKGIKVLKIGRASLKNITAIEEEILALSNKYIDDKLELNDLTGISFTVTDLSAEGVAFFKPLINNMNSAILGISSIDERLDRCTLGVTFDHRVTDGKTVARFLNELKVRLESYQSKFQSPGYHGIRCFKCFKALEDDLSDTGFSKCVTPAGLEAYICQSCFKGF